jgi:MtN3 and saliva related transmembrane protein
MGRLVSSRSASSRAENRVHFSLARTFGSARCVKALPLPTRDSTMSGHELLGFLAAILTTVCWLPQAFRTIRTKDTKSLSLVTQSALTLGVGLWLVYGILADDAPIILANGVTFVLVAAILAMKLRYG